MHGTVGWHATVHAHGFIRAGQIDDAAKASRLHVWQQGMGEFSHRMEIQIHRIVPLRAGSNTRKGARTPSVIDQNVQTTPALHDLLSNLHGGIRLGDVTNNHQWLDAALVLNFLGQAVQQALTARHDGQLATLSGQHLRHAAPQAHTGPRDQCGFSAEL